jgi:hypothetical protein
MKLTVAVMTRIAMMTELIKKLRIIFFFNDICVYIIICRREKRMPRQSRGRSGNFRGQGQSFETEAGHLAGIVADDPR